MAPIMIVRPGHPPVTTSGGPYFATTRDTLPVDRPDLEAEWDRQEAEYTTPARLAADAECDAAHHAEEQATVALLTTVPATIAGAVALLRYLTEECTDDDYMSADCGDDVGTGGSALMKSLLVTLSAFALTSAG